MSFRASVSLILGGRVKIINSVTHLKDCHKSLAIPRDLLTKDGSPIQGILLHDRVETAFA